MNKNQSGNNGDQRINQQQRQQPQQPQQQQPSTGGNRRDDMMIDDASDLTQDAEQDLGDAGADDPTTGGQAARDGGNWPSKTGNPSGAGRGNNPPKK